MNNAWLEKRLTFIERRLAKIEEQLNPQAEIDDRGFDLSAPPLATVVETAEHLAAQPPPLPEVEPYPKAEKVYEPGWESTPPEPRAEHADGAPSSARKPVPIRTIPPLAAKPGFEQTLGLKWAGWIGAVVLTIGAALGIKFAYDQGWFGLLPDEAKLGLMSLAGFGLLIIGEIVFRRIDKIAAAALFGAGVAIFFLVSFAGFNYYHLYERDTAFILMGISTLVGAAVALRGGMVSIAVLSLIGGNIAPIALQSDHPRLIPFLAYLLMLQIVALALCLLGRGARWWTLRGFSLATTSLWMGMILFTWIPLPRGAGAVSFFTLVYAGLYHLELLLSARTFDARVEKGDRTERVSAARARAGMMFSLLVTALLEVALLWLFRHASQEMRGGITLALGALAGAIGFLLRIKDRGPATANHSIGYRIQAATLLVVAVPVALSGIWIVLAWGALALAFAVLGAAIDLPISRRAAVVTWFLGLLYLAAWTAGSIVFPGARNIWLSLFATPIPAYAVLAWLLALVAHAIAALLQSDWSPQKAVNVAVNSNAAEPLAYETPRVRKRAVAMEFLRLAQGMAVLAAVVWSAAALLALPHLGATFMLITYVWLVIGAESVNPKLAIKRHALTIWVLTAMKWALIDGLLVRMLPGWSAGDEMPIVNPFFILGIFLALTAGAFYFRRLREQKAGVPLRPQELASFPLGIIAAMVQIVGIGLGFEIDRAVERLTGPVVWNSLQLKQLLWTSLAMIGACALIAAARRLEPDPRKRSIWARDLEVVPIVIAAKFLIFDTIACRVFYGAALAMPIINFETFTAAIVGAGLFYTLRNTRSGRGATDPKLEARNAASLAIVLILLWAGSLEIDRAFSRMMVDGSVRLFADPERAEQVALSIFWSLFAVASVITGFRLRAAALRYFGLGLFAVTLLKVVAVDMSQVQTGYRILSFLGLGALLLGTSVLYGKLSPKLLSMSQE